MLSSVFLLSFFSFHGLHFSVAARLLSTKLVAREGQHLVFVLVGGARNAVGNWATSMAASKPRDLYFPYSSHLG